MTRPHCVAAIFARGGSKGVPRKNLRLLGGKPLIAHAIETGLATPGVDRVVVSTDDAEIAETARRFGAEVPFLRPAELAQDTSSEWLAWRHAIRTLEAEPGARPIDAFLTLPPTSPLRAVEDVAACLDLFLRGDVDVVITARRTNRSPYFNMIRLDGDGCARLAAVPDTPIVRRQDAPLILDVTTVAYVARPAFVLEADTLFAGRVKAVEVPEERALDIDTELDLRIAGFLHATGDGKTAP